MTYVSSQVPLEYTAYLLKALLPSILLLLFCGDVLRAVRLRLYETLASPVVSVIEV
jgi:hypothetical protein